MGQTVSQDDAVRVENYFDRRALKFDALYDHRNRLHYALNRIFRKALWDRVRMTVDQFGEARDFSVLDVGSGSGRNSVLFVQAGARRVLGIDFAHDMVDLARQYSSENHAEKQCEFVMADFHQYPFRERFDFSVALGVFDYLADPRPTLRRMLEVTDGKVMGSFPGVSLLRAPLRKIRYAMRNCPVYFYTRKELEQICRDVGFAKFQVIPYASSGYFLVGEGRK